MNIIEELQSLDTSDPGRWPLLFRLVSVVVVFVAVAMLGIYMFVIKTELPMLERVELEEQELCRHRHQSSRFRARLELSRRVFLFWARRQLTEAAK